MDTGDIALLTDHSSGEGSRDILVTAIELLTGSPPRVDRRPALHVGGDGEGDPRRRAGPTRGGVRGPGGDTGRGDRLRDPALGTTALRGIPAPAARFRGRLPGSRRRGLSPGHREGPDRRTVPARRRSPHGDDHVASTVTRAGGGRLRPARWRRLGETDDRSGRQRRLPRHHPRAAARRPRALREVGVGLADRSGRPELRRTGSAPPVPRRRPGGSGHAGVRARPDWTPTHPATRPRAASRPSYSAKDLPDELASAAISATRALGLPFSGVDLAVENGVVVFEVNVHPVFGTPRGLETVAVPYVEAHLSSRDR